MCVKNNDDSKKGTLTINKNFLLIETNKLKSFSPRSG